MQFFLSLLPLAAVVAALTITEPTESTVINPQVPFTIKWTSTSGDPQTLTFSLTGAGDFAITQYQELVANVQTSAGSVQIPANVIGTFGQYKIEARDASTSTVLTTSPGFYLAQGNGVTTSITSNGGAVGDGGSGGNTTPATSTATLPGTTTTGNPQINTVTGPDGVSIILSGTVTTTNSATHTTPHSTGSTSAGPSHSTASTTASVSPSQTPNAQVRLGGDGKAMILSMAGMVAGLVALVG